MDQRGIVDIFFGCMRSHRVHVLQNRTYQILQNDFTSITHQLPTAYHRVQYLDHF